MTGSFPSNSASGSPFDLIDTAPPSRHGSDPTLGTIRQILRADKANLIAGLILGVLAIGAAIALCGFAYYLGFSQTPMVRPLSDRRMLAGGAVVFAVLCLLGGIQFLLYFRDHWGLSLKICDLGFSWRSPYGKEEDYLWDHLSAIRVIEADQLNPVDLVRSKAARKSMRLFEQLLTQQTRAKKERSYELVFQPNRRVQLDRNLMVGHNILGDLAMIEGERRGIVPRRYELDDIGQQQEV